jgi:hypothetical protein
MANMNAMKRTLPIRTLVSITISLTVASSMAAADQPGLDPHLEPLRPWLDKTFKSEPTEPRSDKSTTDVARWERALNGKAVRITHSLNDGAYGGEVIVRWDEEKQTVCYHYFTTDTFWTEGTMTFKDGKIASHEIVKGKAEGITEVRATIEMRPDGTYLQKSEFLKDGKWTPGREAVYRQDPAARVIFK